MTPTLHLDVASHTYTLDGVPLPSVSRILDSALGKAPFPDGDYKERGHAVHRATVLIDQGRLGRVSEALVGWLNAYRAFRKDFPHLEWDISEQSLYHPRLLYAGTIDRGTPALIADLKTGVPEKRARLQTAGYAMLRRPDNPRSLARMAVQLRPDGKYRVQEHNNPIDFDAFEGLVHLEKWKNSK